MKETRTPEELPDLAILQLKGHGTGLQAVDHTDYDPVHLNLTPEAERHPSSPCLPNPVNPVVWLRSPGSESVTCVSVRAEHRQGGGGWQQTGGHTHKQVVIQPQQVPQCQGLVWERRRRPAANGGEHQLL